MASISTTPGKEVKNGSKKSKIRRNMENKKNDMNYKKDSTKHFASWYKHMIDYERQNICLYLSDNVTLEWFGRTIRSRKKVSAFLNYDMQSTRHDFRSIQKLEKIHSREERDRSSASPVLATPLTPDIQKLTIKRKSNSNSPEWAENSKSVDNEFICSNRKRLKTTHTEPMNLEENNENKVTSTATSVDISNNGDGAGGVKRKRTSVTPTNVECGQGDCLPSTSGTDSEKSHDTLNAQLPKLAVECNGYIEFTRTRNNHCVDSMKWDRKCKLQISYSEDPLNPGEYIIWGLYYNDESKCRRNLLAAFEEAAKDEE